jgi:phage gpG-like protein
MIKAVLVGGEGLQKWLASRYPEIQGELSRSMAQIVIALTRKIKQEKLSGQVLKNGTGTLRRSISPNVIKDKIGVTGTVGTNVVYARIHEYGGRTPPREILPRRGRALAFMWRGEQRFFKKVQHPGSVIPKHSFMRTALREMEPEIRKEFERAILEVVKQ